MIIGLVLVSYEQGIDIGLQTLLKLKIETIKRFFRGEKTFICFFRHIIIIVAVTFNSHSKDYFNAIRCSESNRKQTIYSLSGTEQVDS